MMNDKNDDKLSSLCLSEWFFSIFALFVLTKFGTYEGYKNVHSSVV